MTQEFLWIAATGLAAIYCLLRAIVDFRAKRLGWAVAGFASAAILLLAPVQTRAIKIDLPAAH